MHGSISGTAPSYANGGSPIYGLIFDGELVRLRRCRMFRHMVDNGTKISAAFGGVTGNAKVIISVWLHPVDLHSRERKKV